MIFQNGFRELFRLDSSGNLGIGLGNTGHTFHPVFDRNQTFIITEQKTVDNWTYIKIMPDSLAESWLLDQDVESYMPVYRQPYHWLLSPELTTLLLLKFS